MHLVFFTHPEFMDHQSMPRFARMLADGMKDRGHTVNMWAPQAICYKKSYPGFIKKWLSYIDQYILFPFIVKRKIRKETTEQTLFIFSDQALGPWVPLVANRPNVIHCHDFLALRSALDEIPENKTSWSGKLYQKYIQKGFSNGAAFISVSQKTQADLHKYIESKKPIHSEVVYNGLNQSFQLQDPVVARGILTSLLGIDLSKGYMLHVGGNQWYKNRIGVVELYTAWRKQSKENIPLLLVGYEPTPDLILAKEHSDVAGDIHFISNLNDEQVRTAYAGTSLFLFPSMAEGFGWPIAEAMASGCLVLTTNEAPMTEVAGKAGFLISRRPVEKKDIQTWATQSARDIQQIMDLSDVERSVAIKKGLENAMRFNTKDALDSIQHIYKMVVENFELKKNRSND